MRRVGVWGMAGVLLAGLATTAARADDKDSGYGTAPATQNNWQATWRVHPAKSPEKKEAKKEAKPVEKPAPAPSAADHEAERTREWNALWRRLEVCARLKQIAVETENADLERQAEQLEERAWEVFEQRFGQRSGAAPVARTEEVGLEKKSGSGSAGRKSGMESGRPGTLREEKP